MLKECSELLTEQLQLGLVVLFRVRCTGAVFIGQGCPATPTFLGVPGPRKGVGLNETSLTPHL